LERPLDAKELDSIIAYTSFKKMAENPAVNYSHFKDLGHHVPGEGHFMRKGKVGDWENYFDKETNEEFENWIKEKKKGGYIFDYKI